MKLLHTADWHVGKILKSRSRFEEHTAVLGDIVRIARVEDVDAVLIAGDLFDSATPSPQAQGLVMRTLLALREDGRQVVALAGNHDNANLFDAVFRPVFGELGLHVLGLPRRPEAGGLVTFSTRRGEVANIAVLPFLPHRFAVRAAEALLHETAGHALDYSRRVAKIIQLLTGGFTPDAVNVVMTHGTLLGGRRGGGERDVQTTLDYELPASVFPTSAHYVALGHLHRQQDINGPCPISYSGSPLAIDFGEETNTPVVLVVSASPDARAVARPVPVAGGRALVTLRGTLAEVIAAGEQAGDAYLRVVLAEPGRAGLGDLVREKLPNALEVQLDDAHRPRPGTHGGTRPSRVGRSPLQLFDDFLGEQNIADERVSRLFAQLLDELASDASEPPGPSPTGAPVVAAEVVPAEPAAKRRRSRRATEDAEPAGTTGRSRAAPRSAGRAGTATGEA